MFQRYQQQPNYPYPPVDPWAETQPQVTPLERQRRRDRRSRPPRWVMPRKKRLSCLPVLLLAVLFTTVLAVYLLFPSRTNVLLLGIDYTPSSNVVGRSDTIVLMTFLPLKPYVGMLSIPRDLWVNIPGVGENRINTAHFFAEAQQAGSGPYATMETIRQNFGVDVHYYVRIRFQGFKNVVDALGGVDVYMPEPMANYDAGLHHLTGNKALAFVRHRMGSDDFFRMEHGQLLMKSVFKQMLQPRSWFRLPKVLLALSQSLDTNIPVWMWPRLGFTLLRLGPDGIDNRTITREMATPFTTASGANVLAPDWSRINPVLKEIFAQ